MRTYIVDSENLEDEIRPLLPEDAEIIKVPNSYTAYQETKKYGKPCSLFVKFSKIAINGKDLVTLVKEHCPHVSIFVMCEGQEGHDTIQNLLSLEKEQVICDSNVCVINRESDIKEIKNILRRWQLVSNLHHAVEDIKTKIGTIQERVNLWQTKIRTDIS